ncbi:hypothetical protein H0H81_004487 [Sphagnurus paluster]|uniref:Uncharacterized protein n=1 Tax=Sphagnurus paluster TaxID=117069 RepID=A0A9P7K2F5_9AGAR|nr:hypothetical protein H0H81_004487 [Sphagnurus paluster]
MSSYHTSHTPITDTSADGRRKRRMSDSSTPAEYTATKVVRGPEDAHVTHARASAVDAERGGSNFTLHNRDDLLHSETESEQEGPMDDTKDNQTGGREAGIVGVETADDSKSSAYRELIKDYNRLQSAFREGEEDRERLNIRICELEDEVHELKAKQRNALQSMYLIGKQLVIQGKQYWDME